MGKPTGFMEYKREETQMQRLLWRESNILMSFIFTLPLEKQQQQGARCMACGVPFCQSGMMIGGMASPAVRCTIWFRSGMIWHISATGRSGLQASEKDQQFPGIYLLAYVRHCVKKPVPAV